MGSNTAFDLQLSRQFHHRDVALRLYPADQKIGKGRQLAAARRTPLPRGLQRTRRRHPLRKADAGRRAHPKTPGRRSTRLPLLNITVNPDPKV